MIKRLLLFGSLLFSAIPLLSQAMPAARQGAALKAGINYSNFAPDYGQNRLSGVGAYFDLDVLTHLGAEGEVRFLRFNQRYDVHEDNYLIGPRYIWRFHRWQPYAKFLLGNGQFNFPFNEAHGGYFIMAPGGGIDYRLNRRFTARVFDYEYQHWSGFQGSSLAPSGFTFGVSYRIF